MTKLFSVILLSTVLVSTILLTTISTNADERNSQNRQEMRELKQQEAEVKVKQKLLLLKSALNLQEHQDQAWNKYEASIFQNISKKRKMASLLREKYRNSDQKPNALELAQANVARLELKLANSKTQYQALEEFYSKLDEQQQQRVDKMLRGKIKREAKRLRKNLKEKSKKDHN